MTVMNKQDIFPVQAMTASSESAIKMEGQKVLFDKKVALMPVDIRKQGEVNIKPGNGRGDRKYGE
jgi:hypothetical protein